MLQGCSKKRPDIYFELNSHCLIVEIDEQIKKLIEFFISLFKMTTSF